MKNYCQNSIFGRQLSFPIDRIRKGLAGGNAYTGMFKQRADRSIADFNRGKTGNDRRGIPLGVATSE